jgi:hypothetical protein
VGAVLFAVMVVGAASASVRFATGPFLVSAATVDKNLCAALLKTHAKVLPPKDTQVPALEPAVLAAVKKDDDVLRQMGAITEDERVTKHVCTFKVYKLPGGLYGVVAITDTRHTERARENFARALLSLTTGWCDVMSMDNIRIDPSTR